MRDTVCREAPMHKPNAGDVSIEASPAFTYSHYLLAFTFSKVLLLYNRLLSPGHPNPAAFLNATSQRILINPKTREG
jgi:hypothetical protein